MTRTSKRTREFDQLVDDLFSLDKQHPYLAQTVEEKPGPSAVKRRPHALSPVAPSVEKDEE